MALASLLFGLGAWVRSAHGALAGIDYPFPSPADLLFVPAYWLFARAIMLFERSRSKEPSFESSIDALIPAAAGTVLIWVTVFGPYVTDPNRPVEERLLNGVYFCLILVLLTATLKLIVTPGIRVMAYRLLSTAVVLFFASDLLGTVAIANGWDTKLFTISALPTATLFCIAVLHRSARHSVDAPVDAEAQLGTARLVMFAVALLIPPMVTLFEFQVMGEREPFDMAFIVVSSVVMVGLVLVRMHRLVRARERMAARERALRKASERLVAAGSVNALNTEAAEALVTVIDSAAVQSAGLAVLLDDGSYEVATVDVGAEIVQPGDRIMFSEGVDDRVGDLLWSGHSDDQERDLYGAPFSVPEENDRILFAYTDTSIDRHDRRAFESLGREIGLARRGLLAAQMIERSRTERRFESLVQNSSDIVIVTDCDLVATYASPALETHLGWKVSDLLGTRITEIVPESERETVLTNLGKLIDSSPSAARIELAVNDADGRRRLIDITVTDLTKHPEVEGYVLNGRDVTEATQLKADLMHAAYHDALTGLPNRTQFTSDVTRSLREVHESHPAVLFVDLDDFKTINDGLGHAAGDQVLRTVAGRLADAAGPNDVAARLGGDEFALLVPDGSDVEAIEALAYRVLDRIREPVDVDGRQMTTSASMGIVVATGAMSAEAVQRNADVAMYRAKAAGKGRFERFEDHMQTHALERLELKADLRRAIDNDELELDYQPIVDLDGLRTSSVEALVRWRHPTRGRVRPDEFIPLAEETGLIHPLGLWVLDEACGQLADWRRDPSTAHLKVAVNLSARQLPEPNLPEEIAQTIARHEIPASQITIEITENVLMDESDFTARRLREVHDLGVSLAIDDFGTGYSSLGYLQRYPFDVLKIDRTFVSGMDQPGPNAEVAAAIIDLASRLDVQTVAEGIETEPELAALTGLGCTCGQGYLLSKPVTPSEISDRLRAEKPLTDTELNGIAPATVAAVPLEAG